MAVFQGTGATDVIEGNFEDDTIRGLGGEDELEGHGGDDVVDGGSGDDFLTGGLFSSFSDHGDDLVSGGDGDDAIIATDGQDTLDGGSGIDSADYDSTAIVANLSTGTVRKLDGSIDKIFEIEELWGSFENDTLIGGNPDSDAYEFFNGRDGADYIDGRSGFDVVDFRGGGIGAIVNLETGIARDGYGNRDTLARVESVIGTFSSDLLSGDSGANSFHGLTGNDTINGRGGIDEVDYRLELSPSFGLGRTGILADLAEQAIRDTSGVRIDKVIQIENVHGSSTATRSEAALRTML